MDMHDNAGGLFFEPLAPEVPLKLSWGTRETLDLPDPEFLPPRARIRPLAILDRQKAEQAVATLAGDLFDSDPIISRKRIIAQAALDALESGRPDLCRQTLQKEWTDRLLPTLGEERVSVDSPSRFLAWKNMPELVRLSVGTALVCGGLYSEFANGISALDALESSTGVILLPENASLAAKISFFGPYLCSMFGVMLLSGSMLSPRGKGRFLQGFLWSASLIALIGIGTLAWKLGAAGGSTILSPVQGPPLSLVGAMSILAGAAVVGAGKFLMGRSSDALFPHEFRVKPEHRFVRTQVGSAESETLELIGLKSLLSGTLETLRLRKTGWIASCLDVLREYQSELEEEEATARNAVRFRYRGQTPSGYEMSSRSMADPINGRSRPVR